MRGVIDRLGSLSEDEQDLCDREAFVHFINVLYVRFCS